MINYLFRIRKYFLIIFLLVIVILGVYFRKIDYLNSEKVLFFVKKANESMILAPFLFILFYISMVVFFIPTLPMNLGAGLIWGTFFGGAITLVSSALGAAIAFLISRYLAFNYFSSKFNGPVWTSIRNEVGKRDWKIVAFTRSNPIFPFGLTSYIFGLSPISFGRFFISTIIFVMPPSFFFAYIGNIAGKIILSNEMQNLMREILIVSFLITIIFIINILVKRYFGVKYNENNIANSD